MDSLQLIFHSIQENNIQHNLSIQNSSFYVVNILICLLVSYYVYTKIVVSLLEKTSIPKLYKVITLHSLWMGLIHLVTTALCYAQISTVLQPSFLTDLHQPSFLGKMMTAAKANFCQYGTECIGNNTVRYFNNSFEETYKWTVYNSVSIYIICAVLIQEIFLATRNKMDDVFYSRLLGLIFVTSAVTTRCPILSIQGTYLMSLNSTSKEIARALVAWKSYSQEDSDHRPPPLIKVITFLFFVIHMVIWFSLMLFYLPFFIHKLPSITKDDANRFFLAYSYLSILAFTVLEATMSPLWSTIRCLGWCRRSSGMTWRILALSDCHLLGHYSPVVLELYRIQMILDQRKARFRNKIVQKHLALVEGRKRKAESDSQARRPPNLLAAVKTVVALKKKIRGRKENTPGRWAISENQPQEIVNTEDSNVKGEITNDNEEIIALMESKQDSDYTSKTVFNEGPEASDKAEEGKEEEKIEKNIIEATASKEGTPILTE